MVLCTQGLHKVYAVCSDVYTVAGISVPVQRAAPVVMETNS